MKRIVSVLFVALPLMVWAEQKSASGVNWEGQIIKATGSGAPNMKASNPAQARLGAEQAAKMDALRNLLAQVKGIQISGGKTVGDEMAKDEIRSKVEGIVRGFKITDKRYFDDSGVEIDVEVPLAALTGALLPKEDASGIALKSDGEQKNTGLVVDAREVKISPALAPRLLDDSGKALYSAAALSDKARASHGVAAWGKSLDQARKDERVGARPLVVKAARANGTDLVLGAEDAKRLAEANNSYLAEGRVIIVTQ